MFKKPGVEILNNSSGPKVVKYLKSRIIMEYLDQFECLTSKKIKNFCEGTDIEPIYAPANNQRAIGLVERLI